MASITTIQFAGTDDLKRQLEEAAGRLNLSLSAYILYLHTRQLPGADTEKIDRMVKEVFGRYGDVMRRLAK